MANAVKKVMVSTGQKQDGQRKYWKQVGTMFKNDEGKYSIKLDVIPMPKMDNNGFPSVWLSLFDLDNNQPPQQPPQQNNQQQPQQQGFHQQNMPMQQQPPQIQYGGDDLAF